MSASAPFSGAQGPIGTPLTASVGGLPIFLPDTARGGYVYQDELPFPVKVSQQVYRYTASGAYYDAPTTVFWVYTASAVVAERYPGIRVSDQDGNRVMQVGSPVPQAANAVYNYTFSTLVGAPVIPTGGGASTFVVPVPTFLLPPGWKLETFCNNSDVGDTSLTPSLFRVRFQTGPTPSADPPPSLAPVATPVLD